MDFTNKRYLFAKQHAHAGVPPGAPHWRLR